MTLPLPESAFSAWKTLFREFGRSLRIVRQYGDESASTWGSYAQTLRHIKRILNPIRIDQTVLTRERIRQQRDEPGGDLATEWDAIAGGYDDLGFAEDALVARRKAAILRDIDWEQVPSGCDDPSDASLPLALQHQLDQLDQLFETDQRMAKRRDLDDIRAIFAADPERYIIMPDEPFNERMVETIVSSQAIHQEIKRFGKSERAPQTLITLSPQHRKEFATAIVQENVELNAELWEYLPSDAPDTTRRSLWVSKDGLRHVVEIGQGTDDDLDQYPVDVEISVWPSGRHVTSFDYVQSTKASRDVKLAAVRQKTETFTDAAQRLSTLGKTGPLAWLQSIPVLGSLVLLFLLALRPRLNFLFFRGLAQQGVKSSMLLRHLGRVALWVGLFSVLGGTGIIWTMLQPLTDGTALWHHIAFGVGLLLGFVTLCKEVPTALGLLVGSFDRRAGRLRWNSNLPKTGHDNFISRSRREVG